MIKDVYENIIKIKQKNNIINEYEDKIKKIKLECENKINEIKNEYNLILQKLNNENKINKSIKEYPNGRYEGELKNNKREGKGIFYHNNGDRYEGEYKNDKRERKGIYYYNV